MNLKVHPSSEEQRAFVRHNAVNRDKTKAEAHDADEDSNFERKISVDVLVSSGICEKLKKIQCLCEKEGKAVATSVVKLSELSSGGIEKKRDDAKLIDCSGDLVKKLEDVQSLERLAFDKLEVTSAFVQTLEVPVKDPDAKFAKMDGVTAKMGGVLRLRVTS